MHAAGKSFGAAAQLGRLCTGSLAASTNLTRPASTIACPGEQTTEETPTARPQTVICATKHAETRVKGNRTEAKSPAKPSQVDTFNLSPEVIRVAPNRIAVGTCFSQTEPFIANVPWTMVSRQKKYKELSWRDVVDDPVLQTLYRRTPEQLIADLKASTADSYIPTIAELTKATPQVSEKNEDCGTYMVDKDFDDDDEVDEDEDLEDDDTESTTDDDQDSSTIEDGSVAQCSGVQQEKQQRTLEPFVSGTTGLIFGYWSKCPFG